MLSYRFLRAFHSAEAKQRFDRDLATIRASGLFDAAWYRTQLRWTPPLWDPLVHYLARGAAKGLDPHPLFDGAFYRRHLPPNLRERVNPFADYLRRGDAADSDPNAWLDVSWYRPAGMAPGTTALAAYLDPERGEGRPPHPLFEIDWYRRRYAGEMAYDDPLADLVRAGLSAGRVPHRALDVPGRPARPKLVRKAVDRATTAREPEGPKHANVGKFNHKRERTFLAEIDEAIAKGALDDAPLVSIVMATRNRAALLPAAVRSVTEQSYRNWELLVVDDGDDGSETVVAGFGDARIRYMRGDGAGLSAARNRAIAAAEGSLVAYLDSDNRWAPDFLRVMVAYRAARKLDLAYAAARLESEDGTRFLARRFSYRALTELDYVSLNAVVHRRALLETRGGFDARLRRMMDWDLLLRLTGDARVGYAAFVGVTCDARREAERIGNRESAAWRFDVLNRHLIDWDRLRAESAGRDRNLVSIVIPVYGKFDLTNGCLESLFADRKAPPFEVVIVNNKSDPTTFAHMTLWAAARKNVRVEASWTNLNFALGCNLGFARSRGGIVVFLNNDTLVSEGWLAPLLAELADGSSVGAVQPKLVYPDRTVQSYGAVFSGAGVISHMLYRGEPEDAPHVNRRRELQAIHGACLAIRAEDFARLDGFDPQFVNGQEDIDLCLRLTAATGRKMAVVPSSTVVHLEGKTRGSNPHNRRNRTLFVERWRGRVEEDADRIYAEDGFAVAAYEPDGEEMAQLNIACFNPRLVRAG